MYAYKTVSTRKQRWKRLVDESNGRTQYLHVVHSQRSNAANNRFFDLHDLPVTFITSTIFPLIYLHPLQQK